tara:strand:- start:4349 stop:5362 length:1014 start_codon:yes stop_codon:yes gene_type:complete
MKVLVTGGAGFIGTHVLVRLIESGYCPVVLDNFSNSSVKSLNAVEEIVGKKIDFFEGDIRDEEVLSKLFSSNSFGAVIHLAGAKSVNESVKNPLIYFENNVGGSLKLFKIMDEYNVRSIVFSSSATVYGIPKELPLKESMPTSEPTNAYGKTKLMIENILAELYLRNKAWNIINLRYFNPIGAHKSGLIGEDPQGIPNNLMPYLTQVAVGKLNQLNIFGDDYETPDGTGIRDYIHVLDLANGHIKALQKLEKDQGIWNINLGTGVGYSVLDLVKTFEKVTNKEIPYKIIHRRPGDVAISYTDPSFAKKEIDWVAEFDLDRMCEDSWRWQSMNPKGYN